MLQPKVFVKDLWYKLSGWKFYQQQQVLHIARQRSIAVAIMACIAFGAIHLRLLDVMIFKGQCYGPTCEIKESGLRQNIVDRNGIILATQLVTASVYANPRVILDARLTAEKLHKLFPHLSYELLLKKLQTNKGFVWVERHLSPSMQQAVHSLGLPGVYLKQDQKRVYPHGSLVSHVIGRCDIDGIGICGIEQTFDVPLSTNKEELKLSLDVRVQHVVHQELSASMQKFSALAANAIVMDVQTGEIIAMVSLPDYDLNRPVESIEHTFNRNTLGIYEQGSVFKILNATIALESGVAAPNSIFDATNPVQIGRFTVKDFRGKHRPLTLVEAIIYSSNVAAIKIAKRFGPRVQKYYIEKFGFLNPVPLEIPELGNTLAPKEWRETSMMTIAYGYGISTTPLHSLTAVASVVNNGYKPTPTLLCIPPQLRQARVEASKLDRCISQKTSQMVRRMMRLVVSKGTARKADIEGYQVFAKTGTAYQSKKGGYGSDANRYRTTSFIGGFPVDTPKYIMIVMLDNPQPTSETYGYATAGWNVTPTAGQIIERIAPLLGVKPDFTEEFDISTDPMQLTAFTEQPYDTH